MAANSRMRRRSPGRWQAHGDRRLLPDREADEHGADGLAVLLGRAGHAGDGEADVGAEDPAGARGHRLGGLGGDDRALGHAEQVELHLAGVGRRPSRGTPSRRRRRR